MTYPLVLVALFSALGWGWCLAELQLGNRSASVVAAFVVLLSVCVASAIGAGLTS